MSESILIPAKEGGSFRAYMAVPKVTPAPAVVVIQEIFGVNQGLRDKCDMLAREGFVAVCPDLFWRIEPGIELTDKTEAEWQRAFGYLKAFDIFQGVEDLRATAHVMKGHAYGSGKIGCIGYCLGGKLAYLMATRTNVDAAVGYYGIGLGALTGDAAKLRHPLMLHIAEEDEYMPKAEQEAVKKALANNKFVTIHSYPGLDHAFSRVGGKHYDKEGAQLADGRTLDFLRTNLGLPMAA